MIRIGEMLVTPESMGGMQSWEKAKIIKMMSSYNKVYQYNSLDELEFDLEVKVKITRAAKLLYKSGAEFETFKNSRCNPVYWILHESGAFFLKLEASPQKAIDDIYFNGRLYAFECATAMVIVYYKAVLDILGSGKFNELFSDMILYDWEYNKNLDLHSSTSTDFLHGDCVYFNNPDFNPQTPEWRGENCIVLDEDLYFAHGMGIKSGEEIMAILNYLRKKNPTEPSYLETGRIRLNYKTYYGANRPF
ncbi:protein-glutamine gamma-glutamyltransferase [Peribacillus deserti]|uniref:Protein-glutamine gamma-glutamyltransferase n=1 Tax=Peribacillus deserti TaxID=673318 RepID=A0A2N5M0E6_9BACI|nr:protein-glutamine gamma-glutamyltransferase [Peribacillus deserti]PLT27844.1 protein-glutamine gamma-glutamyltransferase [Peribacillus deserti]